jgi:hypothetical protein
MSEKITMSFAHEHGIGEQAVAGLEDPKAVKLLDHPGRAFIDCADQINANYIVVGSHKTGPSDCGAGAMASPVIRHAPRSVHVLR